MAALLFAFFMAPVYAAPAVPTPPPSLQIRLWLLPPVEAFDGLEERREKVEPLLRLLLGEEARPQRAKFETQPADLWTAKSWERALPLEERTALTEQARKIWPGKLIVEDPQEVSSQPHGRQFSGSTRWKGIIAEASAAFGVESALIESILISESEGRPSLVSSAGARGLMQLKPATARALGVKNSFEPRQNIMGGTRYLKELLDRFNGNKVLAVAAYNAGPNRQSLRNGHVPNIRETVRYVTRVFARYEQITKDKIDALAYMTGRGRAWAGREASRLARLWGPPPVILAEPRSCLPSTAASLPQSATSGPSTSAADPSRGRAIGLPWNGRLVDGQRLAPQGDGYRSIRQSRGRFYGIGKLVVGLEWTAKQVRAADPSAPPLAIGDLSAQNGGDVSAHRSHENGLDADILLAWKDAEGQPIFADEFINLPAMGSVWHGSKRIQFDAARTWLIIKTLAANPHMQVQYAFLDQSLINAILNHASKAGEDKTVISKASRMLEHWKGHSNHIHIRVK